MSRAVAAAAVRVDSPASGRGCLGGGRAASSRLIQAGPPEALQDLNGHPVGATRSQGAMAVVAPGRCQRRSIGSRYPTEISRGFPFVRVSRG